MLSSHENLSPQTIQLAMKEIRKLARNKLEGIKYIPPEDGASLTEIFAEIAGPVGTPFHGGTFKMKLVLGENYPQSPPKGYFLTKIFHPNVSANGDICVNTLKKDWNADLGIQHVLQVIRCLLIVPFPESSLNDEAGKLFMENYDDYERRATLMTQVHAQKSTVTEDDASADSTAPVGGEVSGGTLAPKASATNVDSVAVAEKKKCAKKKKKNLKRL